MKFLKTYGLISLILLVMTALSCAKAVDEETASTVGRFENLPWELGKTYTYNYIYDGILLGTDTFTLERIDTDNRGEKIYICNTKLDLKGRTTSGDWAIDMKGNPLEYNIKGRVRNIDYSIRCDFFKDKVVVKAMQAGTPIEPTIPLKEKVYLLDNNNISLFAFLFSAIPWKQGKTFSFKIFHPTSLRVLPLQVKIKGKERISIGGSECKCWALDVSFAGTPLKMWVDETGRLLKDEEQGDRLQIQLNNI